MTLRLQTALDALGQSFPDGTAEKLGTLIDELDRWNRKVNLTAIRDRDEMITAHLLDSLVAAPLLKGETVLDVGTGPGFPGLPLAIVQPERQFTLLDSNNKKIMFAQHAAGLLGLSNVSTVKARGEDYAPGHGFDTVIARALAALPRLVEIAGHHVGEDGVTRGNCRSPRRRGRGVCSAERALPGRRNRKTRLTVESHSKRA